MTERWISTRWGPWVGSLALALSAIGGDDPGLAPEVVAIVGVENAYRLGPKLYSGSQPEGPESFEAMTRMGIKTILSVDGSEPDVETAKHYGLRYVHLPIGYDGISRDRAIEIAKAAATLPGPVFLHCHHGKHRGPAAAAVCMVASGGWDRDRASAWMRVAGTSPDYAGLHASVRDFAPPSKDEWDRAGNVFPERVAAPAMIDLMVKLDGRWDKVKAAKVAGFKPKDHDLARELVQVRELAREMARLPAVEAKGPDFGARIKAFEQSSAELEAALEGLGADAGGVNRTRAESVFAAMSKSCTSCHARHRDR